MLLEDLSVLGVGWGCPDLFFKGSDEPSLSSGCLLRLETLTQALNNIYPVRDSCPGNHSNGCVVIVAVASVIKAKGSHSAPGDTPQGGRDSKRHVHAHVRSSTIHNRRRRETTQVSTERWMDK